MERIQSDNGRYGDDERAELQGDTFEKNDHPGTDLFDEALGPDRQLKMPGSTVTESSPNYMENKGPNDLVHRPEDRDKVLGELDPEISIRKADEVEGSLDDGENAADKWMREQGHGW